MVCDAPFCSQIAHITHHTLRIATLRGRIIRKTCNNYKGQGHREKTVSPLLVKGTEKSIFSSLIYRNESEFIIIVVSLTPSCFSAPSKMPKIYSKNIGEMTDTRDNSTMIPLCTYLGFIQVSNFFQFLEYSFMSASGSELE